MILERHRLAPLLALLLAAVFYCAIQMSAHPALARSKKIGDIVPLLNIDARIFREGGARKVVWETIIQLRTSRMRLHLTGVVIGDNTSKFDVVVRDVDNTEMLRIPSSELSAQPDYWTTSIPRSFVIVQVETPDGSIPEGLSFAITEAIVDHKEIEPQDVTWPNDMQWAAYALLNRKNGRPVYWKRGRSTAILRFITESGEHQCSGFMISDNEMMTNAHCIYSSRVCRSAVATFGYEQSERLRPLDGEEFSCSSLEAVDKTLDFAVLALKGAPGTPSRWGHLVLSSQRPTKGQPLYIIHYPNDARMKGTWNDCNLLSPGITGFDPNVESDFGHLCDTDAGSSGSPILSQATNEVAGLHHFGFTQCDPKLRTQNRGVYMDLIINRLAEIKKNGDSGVTEDGPAPDESKVCPER